MASGPITAWQTEEKKVEVMIDAFKLWCWRRLLKIPWTRRRSNPSILKINPEYSLEGLVLQLKLQYFGHLMRSDDWLGKIEGRRRKGVRGWDGWMASPMQRTWTWANCRRWWGTGRPGVPQFMQLQRVGHNWATEQQMCSASSDQNQKT